MKNKENGTIAFLLAVPTLATVGGRIVGNAGGNTVREAVGWGLIATSAAIVGVVYMRGRRRPPQ